MKYRGSTSGAVKRERIVARTRTRKKLVLGASLLCPVMASNEGVCELMDEAADDVEGVFERKLVVKELFLGSKRGVDVLVFGVDEPVWGVEEPLE